MINMADAEHHSAIQEISEMLSEKIGNADLPFFRNVVAFFLSVMASSMRAEIHTRDRGVLPVNNYCIALAPSGAGKGASVSTMENQLLGGFRRRYMEETFPTVAMWSLEAEANRRAAFNGGDEEEEYKKLEAEFQRFGAYQFVGDDATGPALKTQIRPKLQMAKTGAINLQVDEIGSNLTTVMEALNVFLELYDLGHVKSKITKNTVDSKRAGYTEGATPANCLLFGTPSKLLDGHKTESEFFALLETGYARRSLFCYGEPQRLYDDLTAQEIFDKLVSPKNNNTLHHWTNHFTQLADPDKNGWALEVPDDVSVALIEYRLDCEKRASTLLSDYNEVERAELEHRYFKCLKLAATFAFVDEQSQVTMAHLKSAILLVEESGDAFKRLIKREQPYMKLARYIAAEGRELTNADLMENLPFFKTSKTQQNEMLDNATAWGYNNNIIIKRNYRDNVELISGESLQVVDLDDVRFTYSNDFAYNYGSEEGPVPFNKLDVLIKQPGLHWCAHEFTNGHRTKDNAIPGFDLIVIDVDGSCPADVAADLMHDYKFMLHTTKRHTETEHRFRMVFPMNYRLELDKEEYADFMQNFLDWLPFTVDDTSATCDIARKWMTNPNAQIHFNEGEQVVDVLPFIPKTSRNVEYKKEGKKLRNHTSLERWFAKRISSGNRNNQMIKYAFALVDSGLPYADVEASVLDFNKRLDSSLAQEELERTVLVSVAKRYQTP